MRFLAARCCLPVRSSTAETPDTKSQQTLPAGGDWSGTNPAAERYSSNPGVAWPATDALKRILPQQEAVGPARPDRFVGIFYFLTFGQHEPNDAPPSVVTDILRKYPDALNTPSSPPWGPMGSPHFWGEPLYGFYLNSDPWVIRRHAHLLAQAGVDTLIFDTTNAITYRDVYFKICEVFRQIRAEGGRTPQIAFMVNTEAARSAQEIYEDLYQPGLYQELWFRWQGRPLMICDPEKASPEVRAFFTLRRAHWPFTQVDTPYAWHWEAAYPQVYGYTTDPKIPEEVNVSVAQNLRQSDAKVTNMSNGDARGRSFHNGSEDTSAGAILHGFNFQEQWERALKLDPPFVMVTGWNEWAAGRFARPGHGVVFVDQFNEEYSRDIEMMKGGHGDDYYYQLVANVRRYKGMPALRQASAPKTIPPGGFHQWRDVRPEYRDPPGETTPRDYDGVGNLHYANHTGRNDLLVMKVARDSKNVYFYARTREPITRPSGMNWMNLLIDIDHDASTGWQGYDYIVNRTRTGAGQTSLERNVGGGWNWARVTSVAYSFKGNELQIAVPRAALGIPPDSTELTFDFKWTDNLQKPGDVMDFYVSGDVAPDGRFNYRYIAKNIPRGE